MKLAVFGEHVGLLHSLGVTLEQLAIPMERFTSPPEDSLPLLQHYFWALVTGTMRRGWCLVLYVVALSHLNTLVFSQDAGSQVLRSHLLPFSLPQKDAELGIGTYDHLPRFWQCRLESVLGTQEVSDSKGE
ncbi:hypothetical protein J4Q44_G00222140 [Coregonus suidteri]|uniref:RPAP1/MINIYO-like TPR repeats domain-containing protein n=1 Tax=Coregonus suidteri TaxID=861788 RepID=A0AAN8LS96_9TELE